MKAAIFAEPGRIMIEDRPIPDIGPTDAMVRITATTICGTDISDHHIVTTLCPGGKDWMRRLLSIVESCRVDLKPLVTHRFKFDDIEAAYDLLGHQRDGVLKVAITP